MRIFHDCLNLHWAAFFSFLHLITKFNWLHRGDRLRWLTREQELKWQQLMRRTGTQGVRLCCCSNSNFSKQHADSSDDTESSYRPFSCTLHIYTHSKVLYAYGKWTMNTYTGTQTYIIRPEELSNWYSNNQQFLFFLWSSFISPSFTFTPG